MSEAAKRTLPPLPYAEASEAYAAKFEEVMEEHRQAAAKRAWEAGDEEKAEELSKPRDYTKGIQEQSLWDASMAYAIAQALTRRPGSSMLHVNGSFQSAERLGILDHLVRYRPGVSTLVVTILSADSFPELDRGHRGRGDFVIVTDPDLPRTYTVDPRPKSDEKGKDDDESSSES